VSKKLGNPSVVLPDGMFLSQPGSPPPRSLKIDVMESHTHTTAIALLLSANRFVAIFA